MRARASVTMMDCLDTAALGVQTADEPCKVELENVARVGTKADMIELLEDC